jgi:membrane protease YdiL (CAAX protease family)
MPFYVKKYLSLDLTVTLLLGGIGYWGIRYLSYHFTHNLAVPVLAHGLFDLGGVAYFQRLMLKRYVIVFANALEN